MKIISHRGESKFAPENTLKSFYLSDFLDDDGIECDIRKTKDDKIVIIHDMTVNRTSNGIGFVGNKTYEELLSYNFGYSNNYEKIITLDEFLNLFSKKNMLLYVEIKEEGYEKLIIDILKKYSNKNIYLITFNYRILKNIREINDNIKIAWLVFDYNTIVENYAKTKNINMIICPSLLINEEKVKRIKEHNMIVSAWALLSKSEIKRLYKLGVDNIIFSSGYYGKKEIND